MMKIPKMVTIDKLAQMIVRGFEGVDKKFEELERRLNSRIDKLENRMNTLEERMGFLESKFEGINNRIDDLALNRSTRDEVYSLTKRIIQIENKLGLRFKT